MFDIDSDNDVNYENENENDYEFNDDKGENEETEIEPSLGSKKSLSSEQMMKLKSLFDRINENPDNALSEVNESSELKVIQNLLDDHKENLRTASRTARLWLQYIDYVAILKLYIRAERTGNWRLHLHAVEKMLNVFATTGHVNYARCARLYLQNMNNLHNTHPQFSNGFHTVRRTDK